MDNKLELVSENAFKVKSRFGELIGRGLISNAIVAVSEIVKNSYDADADNIKIEFNLNGDDSISFIDDGDGMSYDDIINKWLAVGTDNKIFSPITKKGRRKLGEKGIGRFAIERLGSKAIVYTKKIDSDFEYVLELDWDKFEQDENNFTDVKHKIFKRTSDKNLKGTKIVISRLRDEWKENDLKKVKRQLELIVPIDINSVSVNKYDIDSNVNIELVVNNTLLTDKNKIDNLFLSHYQAHLYGQIFEDGSSKSIVEISEKISTNNKSVRDEENYGENLEKKKCGPFIFEAFVYFKDKRLYKTFDVDRSEVDDFLNKYCGVKIYRDGFRILPFGDENNDWLDLNGERNRSPEHRISTQNVIGIVYINRDKNPGLQDVLNRENIQDSPEFETLKNFIKSIFDKYSKIQLRNRNDKERKIKEKGEEVLLATKEKISSLTSQANKIQKNLEIASETLLSNINNKEEIVKKLNSVNENVSSFLLTVGDSLKGIKDAYSYYKKENEFKKREVQIYRNIATLGISAAIFGHETANRTLNCKLISEDIYKLVVEIESIKSDYIELCNDLKIINDNADFFRHYLSKEKQRKQKDCDLFTICKNVIEQHESVFETINIRPTISMDENSSLFLNGYEGDFYTIFTNLITNAYKALKVDRKGTFLNFHFKNEGFSIIIDVVNDGNPIKEEEREKVFFPLYSTYADGTGLGLTIISDTLDLYKGNIKLLDDFPETHFRIEIPLISKE